MHFCNSGENWIVPNWFMASRKTANTTFLVGVATSFDLSIYSCSSLSIQRRVDSLFLRGAHHPTRSSYLSGVSTKGNCRFWPKGFFWTLLWYPNNLIFALSDTWDYTPHLRAITVVSQTHGITRSSAKDPQLIMVCYSKFENVQTLKFDMAILIATQITTNMLCTCMVLI